MIQGVGSNVGKSLLVAGLCRAFWRRGLTVSPFKPQNMSNNAAVTIDGGEIGRAQALQAMAAKVEAHSDLNPVLLKPQSEVGAAVILQGKYLDSVRARDYARFKPQLMTAILDSFHRVERASDLVLIEGAGSPAETNLRAGDIANMGFAEAVNAPVLLVGDIDRGGVIAQLVGTRTVLAKPDRDRIKGFIINKFRGDLAIFSPALDDIVSRTGWHAIGVMPWFGAARKLPSEDAQDIRSKTGDGRFRIAVPRLSRIANFDDLDPLSQEPGVTVEMIEPGDPLPAGADLVLIPGTKSTIADLAFFRAEGWDIDLAAHIRRGGHVLGICGGYQMLGREVIDSDGLEGQPARVDGLGHLDVVTRMTAEKSLANVKAEYLQNGLVLDGYEIHIGTTTGPDCTRGWLSVNDRIEGAQSRDGRVQGSYLHGLFASNRFRQAYLQALGAETSGFDYQREVETTLEALADTVERNLDLDLVLRLAE